MVNPYKNSESGKKAQVEEMFDQIAPKYDFLNHFLSLGIDKLWRKKAIRILKPFQPKEILDLATGTGDLAIAALRLKPDKVVGIDISEGMLRKGREKLKRKSLQDRIELIQADSEDLPFDDLSFDALTVAFGVRNFEDLQKGLNEMFRVLKPGGAFVILEFSRPERFPFKEIYNFYFFKILPKIGKIISRDGSAYTYLPESVEAFPDGDEFLCRLGDAGFSELSFKRLSFGVASLYTGVRENHNNLPVS